MREATNARRADLAKQIMMKNVGGLCCSRKEASSCGRKRVGELSGETTTNSPSFMFQEEQLRSQ